jgi:hypothetical protein
MEFSLRFVSENLSRKRLRLRRRFCPVQQVIQVEKLLQDVFLGESPNAESTAPKVAWYSLADNSALPVTTGRGTSTRINNRQLVRVDSEASKACRTIF